LTIPAAAHSLVRASPAALSRLMGERSVGLDKCLSQRGNRDRRGLAMEIKRYSHHRMQSLRRQGGLGVLVLAVLLELIGMAGPATAATPCSEIPTVYGIPPWGFHTGPYTDTSSFAKGHGNVDLGANTVSGVICQQDRSGVIIMSVEHHIVYHSHYAKMWRYP